MELTGGYTFYKGNAPDGVPKDALSFSDDPDGTKYPVMSGSSILGEITGVTHPSRTSIQFDYYNWNDSGQYKYSGYGIYIGDASGNWVGELDPIVSNGGMGDGGYGPRHRHHARPRHHHHR